ncbi:MAG: lysozyme [Pseudomonadota bacterium]
MWRFLLLTAAILTAAAFYLSEIGLPQAWKDDLPAPAASAVEYVESLELVAMTTGLIDRLRGPQDPADAALSEAEASKDKGPIAANQALRMNEEGLAIIKRSEGLRLEAYEKGGQLYIGYGHQMAPGEPRLIDEAEAERLLREDVREKEDGVKQLLRRRANENEFSAMVSLAYNLGVGGFSRSQVLTAFNAGDKQAAADAFRNHNRGGGEVLPHLVERRELERKLFLKRG